MSDSNSNEESEEDEHIVLDLKKFSQPVVDHVLAIASAQDFLETNEEYRALGKDEKELTKYFLDNLLDSIKNISKLKNAGQTSIDQWDFLSTYRGPVKFSQNIMRYTAGLAMREVDRISKES